ncbi:GNAT family N-acetyltransferase [Flagellimonas flava]|uniref:L-amino acid N-acyltransferase YncA n=1 Tax=Flagellimonas flava TaxID=570519 RepID=A0A1M5LSP9_9FLAO|nr:GNAT family N-acetyltransferase [Allomuricauda flava]SHG67930.1 L-amino acid N-acyltransferase YncA [Allomuricauda flava]
MKLDINIRPAKPEDIEGIIPLCAAHAAYEKCPYQSSGKKEGLITAIFQHPKKMHCLVVECDKILIGYATYMEQFSTWDASPYLYLDCIFLKEYARGLGIGEKLLKRIQDEGQRMGCLEMQWQTPVFNTRAVQFYERLGAKRKSKLRFFLNTQGFN